MSTFATCRPFKTPKDVCKIKWYHGAWGGNFYFADVYLIYSHNLILYVVLA